MKYNNIKRTSQKTRIGMLTRKNLIVKNAITTNRTNKVKKRRKCFSKLERGRCVPTGVINCPVDKTRGEFANIFLLSRSMSSPERGCMPESGKSIKIIEFECFSRYPCRACTYSVDHLKPTRCTNRVDLNYPEPLLRRVIATS